MTQYIRPTSDQSTGSWTSTPLWSKVDDDLVSTPSGDGVTIASADNSAGDTAQLNLDSSAADPGVSTDHIMRIRWNKSASGGHQIDAVCNLIDATNGTIATISVTNIGNTEQEDTHTLTAGEVANISDYTTLDVAFVRNGETGGAPSGRRSLVVEAFVLEMPDADTSQTIVVGTGIASAETFGSAALIQEQFISPTGIASAEATGTPTTLLYVSTTGIASAEALGSLQLNLQLAPSGIASAEAFGTLTGILYIAGSGIASAEAFGTLEIKEVQSLVPTGIASAEALGSLQLNLQLAPSGIASAEALGTLQLLQEQFIGPTGIASAEALGTLQLRQVTSISPTGIASAEALGTLQLNLALVASGIASAEALGTLQLNQILMAAGIASAEALGTLQLNLQLAPSGIASGEAFGALVISTPGGTTIVPIVYYYQHITLGG